jgi:hypothetical protein
MPEAAGDKSPKKGGRRLSQKQKQQQTQQQELYHEQYQEQELDEEQHNDRSEDEEDDEQLSNGEEEDEEGEISIDDEDAAPYVPHIEPREIRLTHHYKHTYAGGWRPDPRPIVATHLTIPFDRDFLPLRLRGLRARVSNNIIRAQNPTNRTQLLYEALEYDWTPPRTPIFQTDEEIEEEQKRTDERKARQAERERFAVKLLEVGKDIKALGLIRRYSL